MEANPGIRSWKSTYPNEPDVRKPLVESISHRREELRLYNLVQYMAILDPTKKVYCIQMRILAEYFFFIFYFG